MSKQGYVVNFQYETSECPDRTQAGITLMGQDLRKIVDLALSRTTPRARRDIGQLVGQLFERDYAQRVNTGCYYSAPYWCVLAITLAEIVE